MLGSGNLISGALLSPMTAELGSACPKHGCIKWAAIAGLGDPSLEALKAPWSAPDPNNMVWPILATSDGGKCVADSGSVTLLPKPCPSSHPPVQYETGPWRGESPQGSPDQTNCSRENPSCSMCLFYKSHRQIQAGADLTFYFS